MDHLAARMEQLIDTPSFDFDGDSDSLAILVRDLLEPGRRTAMRAALGNLRTDGIQAAADWLVRRLTEFS